ncbi:MAG: hypothetical protein OHK0045_01010 [Raineya sp.]
MFLKNFLFVLSFFAGLGCGVSQDFRYTFHQFNAFAVNPAMAAMQKQFSVSYHSRKQRVEAGLSHRTLMLSALYPFLEAEKHYGTIGLSLHQDRQSYFGKTHAFDIVAATNFDLHKEKNIKLALGLQGGSRTIEDELQGTEYFPAWGAGLMLYQDLHANPYQKHWFLGASGSNFLGNDRFLENYYFAGETRWIISGGLLLWTNGKYSLVPNFRSILHKQINFSNYGLSLRRNFSENSGTLFRYGSWGLSAWYAHQQAISIAIDIDTPALTMGFAYAFHSEKQLFSYKDANEFVITIKKSLHKKRNFDDKPVINETEKPL